MIDRLRAGESIALVSDAGTPLISDPGQTLVRAARGAGIRVESIPGPSAVMAALSPSGLQAEQFVFLGFPPIRSKDEKWLCGALSAKRDWPYSSRLHIESGRTLTDLDAVLGPDRQIAVGRELTKAHEELVIRPITELFQYHLESAEGRVHLLIVPSLMRTGIGKVESLPLYLRSEVGHMIENERA